MSTRRRARGLALDTQSPISPADAKNLGKFLGEYDIKLSRLDVWHVDAAGGWHRDDPLADTVKETAGSVVAAVGTTAVMGPAAVSAGTVLVGIMGPFALPAALMAAIGSTFANFKLRQGLSGAVTCNAVASRVEFDFDRMTDRWRPWAEYLVQVWACHQGWDFSGWRHEDRIRQAQGYAARNPGKMPPPWKRSGGKARRGRASASLVGPRRRKRKRGAM